MNEPTNTEIASTRCEDQKQRTMGMLCHLLALIGIVATANTFGPFIGPLIVWLVKKDEMPFVDDQGKEALNFQITVFLAMIACGILFFLFIFIFLFIKSLKLSFDIIDLRIYCSFS